MTLLKFHVKIPYRHPNHKNRYSKKWEMSKDSGTNVIKSPDDRSVWNANSPQQINLVWIDSSLLHFDPKSGIHISKVVLNS